MRQSLLVIWVKTTTMPLKLSHVTESNIPAVTAVNFRAFAPDPAFSAIFPNGGSPDTIAHYSAIDTEILRTDETLHYLMIFDSDTGEIAALAQWHVFPEKTREELDKPIDLKLPADANADLGYRLFGHGIKKRNEIMGTQPYVFLAVLGTAPEHRRKGAARMLMKWGTDKADALELPCYLESTAAGLPVYRQAGFEVVEDFKIDLSPYKDHGKGNFAMIRKARRKAKGD